MKRIGSLFAASMLLIGLFAAVPGPVKAAPFATSVDAWVSKSGPTASEGGGESCRRPGYRSIEQAVANASDGDVIHVCRGTYFEHDIDLAANPDLTTGVLTIQGEGPSRTIINAMGRGAAFTYADTEYVEPATIAVFNQKIRVADMTIKNGYAHDESPLILDEFSAGGAISAINVDCSNVRFDNNTAEVGGAIAAVMNVNSDHCTYVNNHGFVGGAIATYGEVHDTSGVYTKNNGTDDIDLGDLAGLVDEIFGPILSEDLAAAGEPALIGGAVVALNIGAPLICTVFIGFGTEQCRTVFPDNDFASDFTGTTFASNIALIGGAVFSVSCTDIAGAKFSGNIGAMGGALAMLDLSMMGIPLLDACGSSISNSSFYRNSGHMGGAMLNLGLADDSSSSPYYDATTGFISSTEGLVMSDNTFTANRARYGGAIYGDGTVIHLTGGTFTGNVAFDAGAGSGSGYGSGVYMADNSWLDWTDVTASKNRAAHQPGTSWLMTHGESTGLEILLSGAMTVLRQAGVSFR